MPVNELELRVYGLMRSGNHAIIEWILGLFPGEKTCFLNNVDHGPTDPFATARKSIIGGFDTALDLQACRQEDKTLLIYSYEDRKQLKKTGTPFLDSVFSSAFEDKREGYLGQSRKKRDVLILRDPFNCFASRLVMIRDRGALGGMKRLPDIAQNWKDLARRALQIRGGSMDAEMVILFNKWIASRVYRQRIADELGGQYCEASMQEVSTFGGGSSFSKRATAVHSAPGVIAQLRGVLDKHDERQFIQRLQRRFAPRWYQRKMLTRRWNGLRTNPRFRKLFRDPEILELSEALFGEIPDTRDFVRDVLS